jgi:ferredoxin
MRVVVDLNRCQSYGQCVFAAPEVFRFRGAESLEYDHGPDAGSHRAVERAALACPVQAILLGRSAEAGAVSHNTAVPEVAAVAVHNTAAAEMR